MIINTSLKMKKKKNIRLVKSLTKKEPLKKLTKDNASNFNKWLIEKKQA